MTRTRSQPDPSAEEGFSLVEVLVALGLSAVVLLALLSSSIFAVQATVEARHNQQAADYVNEGIEAGRSLDYASVSMLTSDLSGDPDIVNVAGAQKYDPGTGRETIDSSTTGVVTPHIQTSDTTNGSYTTKRYVTIPSGATYNAQGLPSVRRLTVSVSFETRGKTHTRRSSTLLTLTRRGLPLPNFTWKYNGPATVISNVPTWVKNPGSTVDYGLVLTNLGARDSWALSSDTVGWTYFLDNDHDGLWSGDLVGEPILLPADTGLIEPSSLPVYVVAHRTIGLGESGTTTTVFSATSNASPTISKTVTTELTVQSGAVVVPTASPTPTPTATATATPPANCNPGTATGVTATNTVPTATTHTQYTLQTLSLFNSAGLGDSTATASNSMGQDSSAIEPDLCNWSTDYQTDQAGRYLAASSGSGTATTANTVEFAFQPASNLQDQFRGDPVLSVYLQCPVGSPVVSVTLLTLSGSTYTSVGSGSITATGCSSAGFRRFSLQITNTPTSGYALGALTDKLVLRLTSSQDVRIGYGASSVPAEFTVGMK